MSDNHKIVSKFLSLILRHQPEKIGLTLDKNGWAKVDELLEKSVLHKVPLTSALLDTIVETNNKKRFVFSDDRKRIRASQGHSVDVDLQLKEVIPPARLYHGTAFKNLESIKVAGLVKRNRHHVHLSGDYDTALQVGQRHGKPFVMEIDTKAMHNAGFTFYQSENGVWLVEEVPSKYLNFDPPEEKRQLRY